MANSSNAEIFKRTLASELNVIVDMYESLPTEQFTIKAMDKENNFVYSNSIDRKILSRYKDDVYFYQDMYRQFEYAIKDNRKKLGVDEVTGKKYFNKYVYKPTYVFDSDEIYQITKSMTGIPSSQPNIYDAFGDDRRAEERKKLKKYGRY